MQREGIINGVSRTGKYSYHVESSELYAVEKEFKTIPQGEGEGEGWVTDTKDLLATPLYQLLLKMIFQDTDIQRCLRIYCTKSFDVFLLSHIWSV